MPMSLFGIWCFILLPYIFFVNDLETIRQWVAKTQVGDAQAFESLFRVYCEALIQFAYRFVQDRARAENIVQDVFLNIWTNRTALDPDRNFKAYVYAAVRNRALKELEHQQVVRDAEVDLKTRLGIVRTPEDDYVSHETGEAIRQAIKELPQRCQTIFNMSRLDRLTYGEIAVILGLSVKTVETQMGRALKTLREKLRHLLLL